ACGVPRMQPEDPLRPEFDKVVRNLGGWPRAPQTAGDRLCHPKLLVEGLEEYRAAVGTGVPGIELRNDLFVEFEGDLGYTVCGHRASSSVCVRTSQQLSFRTLRALDGSLLSSFTHNPR